jgi:hypothetical protein
LKPRPVAAQYEYVGIEPTVSDKTTVASGNNPHTHYDGSGDKRTLRNLQSLDHSVDYNSTVRAELKVPCGEADNHYDSSVVGPRNPQEYCPTQNVTKRPNDPQYQPQSPSDHNPDYTLFLQRPNDPQGDGTAHVISSSTIYARNSTADAEQLKQELVLMEAQSLELERKRKENQERLRQLLEADRRS